MTVIGLSSRRDGACLVGICRAGDDTIAGQAVAV